MTPEAAGSVAQDATPRSSAPVAATPLAAAPLAPPPVRDVSEASAAWALSILALAYVLGMGWLVFDRHAHLATSCFDLGIHDQATWLISRGLNPFATARGMQVQADHFYPILYLVAPLYWLWDGPETLLAVQVVALAAGILPVYHLALSTLGHRGGALIFAFLYLVHPSLLWANEFDFHGSTLATTFLLFMLWHLESGRERSYWHATLLVLLSSEFGGMSVALVGMVTWWNGRRRLGTLTVLAGAVGLALAATTMRACNHGLPSAYSSLYAGVHPLDRIFSHDGLAYTVGLLGPLVFMPILAPGRLLPALPVFLGNLLSWRESQCTLHYHYGASILPFVMWAGVLGYARLCRFAPRVPWVGLRPRTPPTVLLGTRGGISLAMLALALGVAWVRGPLDDGLPPREFRAPAEALAVVPPHASVSADNDLGGHLGGRPELYLFPNPFQAMAWGSAPQALADQTARGTEPLAPGALRRAIQDTRVEWVILHPRSTEGFPCPIPDRAYLYSLTVQAPEYGVALQRDGLVALRRGQARATPPLPFPRDHLGRWLQARRARGF